MRIIEFFCGIGGLAAAVGEAAEIVAAIDISRAALGVYEMNFPHRTIARELETISAESIGQCGAELWWMSPPCQPYTCRGRQRDVDDPRARSLLTLMQRIEELRPSYLALENVPAFATSRAHGRIREALDRCGYSVWEQIICPTELGVPMQRQRFYLTAARGGSSISPPALLHRHRALNGFVDPAADDDPRLQLDSRALDRYRRAIHVVDRNDPAAAAHCFTAAYGRSYVRSGSYIESPRGVRRFSPGEILRLLGFGRSFRLPADTSLEKAWQLAGNSLSVDVVRQVVAPLLACTPVRSR